MAEVWELSWQGRKLEKKAEDTPFRPGPLFPSPYSFLLFFVSKDIDYLLGADTGIWVPIAVYSPNGHWSLMGTAVKVLKQGDPGPRGMFSC